MINEEKIINETFGKEKPFRVPDGYFDNLADQIMAKIPMQEIEPLAPSGESLAEPKVMADEQAVAKQVDLRFWHRLPVRKIAAAVALAAMLGGGVLYQLQREETKHMPLAHHEPAAVESAHVTDGDDADFEQMADYTMMDSQDFYAQLVAEN